MAGPALRSPALALACVAAGIVVAVLAWSQLERSLIPSFKETDVFVELQAPAGTSVQAMDRLTATLITICERSRMRNAAAQIGRALLSHEVSDMNSAQVWVSLDPKADLRGDAEAVQQVVAAQPGVDGEVQAYLSKKMREGLTGEDQAISVRVYGKILAFSAPRQKRLRQVLAGISGVKSPEVEPQPSNRKSPSRSISRKPRITS